MGGEGVDCGGAGGETRGGFVRGGIGGEEVEDGAFETEGWGEVGWAVGDGDGGWWVGGRVWGDCR